MHELRDGAIVIMDALGVKGSWQTQDGESLEVIGTLATALETAEGLRQYLENALVPRCFAPRLGFEPRVSVLSLSDTLVVAAQIPTASNIERTDAIEAALVDMVCQCAAYVIRKAAQKQPPLVYRGVVTSGRMLIEGTFLLGPAVDEAGQLFESAAGAFVWLSQRAAQLRPPAYGGPNVWRTMMFEYSVPLKGGGSRQTKVVSPFVDTAPGTPERAAIRAGYELAMTGDRADVVAKRENTMPFIDHVHAKSDDS